MLIILVASSCYKQSQLLSLKKGNADKLIALQPIGEYEEDKLKLLQIFMRDFFQTKVIILKSIQAPEEFFIKEQNAYSADSFLNLIYTSIPDSLTEVIGLTHQEIVSIERKSVSSTHPNEVVSWYQKLRGFSYISKNSCIISDYSLLSADENLWSKRIRKVILHEVGHNLGIDHCKDENCIMSEKNGNIANLNKDSIELCVQCRKKLN